MNLRQWLCGRRGHHYHLTAYGLDDGLTSTYTIDPLALCEHCKLVLPTRFYERITTEIEGISDQGQA